MAAKTGKDGGEEGLMTAAEMKPLLHLAKRQPVNCAIAMDKGKQGIILLHRKTRSKKLLAELKAQAKAKGLVLDLTSVRFGRVSVDGASDNGLATFTVNKPAPGPMRRAMLEQVRPAGLQRCEIVVDEGLENETDDDEAPGGADPGDPAPSGPANAARADGAPPGSDAKSQGSPGSPAGGLPDGASADAGPDLEAPAPAPPAAGASAPSWQDRLRPALADLARRVATTSELGTPRRIELSGLAYRANDAMKAGDMAGAVAATRNLHRALDAAPDAPGPGNTVGMDGQRLDASPERPGSTAAALRAGFDQRAGTPRDRSGDAQVADSTPRGTDTDAGRPGSTPAPMPTPAPAQPPGPPANDTSWVGADGWDYRAVPPGTPPVVMDVPRALGEFDDAHGRVLTRAAGGLQAVGAVGEGVVAGGLVAAPEPTMLSKAAGVAMGANAADNLQAGLRTAWTGQPHHTLIAEAAGAGAHALGASPERAGRIANGVDVGQGLAGFGATTVAGIARGGVGMTARGANAVERGAPPTLAGDVLPPNQSFALGGTQVRQAPVQPAWPQTVTAGPNRVDMNGPSVQPRKPPQLTPPPEPPPPPTAEQQVQAAPGHGHVRHGEQTTLAEQEHRLLTDIAPDLKRAPANVATRFDSHEAELDAINRAAARMKARDSAGKTSHTMRLPPPGSPREARLARTTIVVSGHPGGYGSGLRRTGSGASMVVTPTGQFPNALVVLDRDPLTGEWKPVSQYPTNKPVTPPP